MKLFITKFNSEGIHEKHVVENWNLGINLSICFQTQGNQENLCRGDRSQDLPQTNVILQECKKHYQIICFSTILIISKYKLCYGSLHVEKIHSELRKQVRSSTKHSFCHLREINLQNLLFPKLSISSAHNHKLFLLHSF